MKVTKEEIAKIKVPTREEAVKLVEEAKEFELAMLQMYQSGFLDGYNEERAKAVKFDKISKKCKKAFENRFIMSISKAMQKAKRDETKTSNMV